ISRTSISWGIPLPWDERHVAYVWFDALINYCTAVGYPDDRERFDRYWPADYHLIAKDILRQHAVYWPIMLHALGIEPPKTVFAHGWWLSGETKMSKSRGNVVAPQEVAARYGVDAYRYFLLRDVPFGLDGNFSEESIVKRYNSDLANDLGNLVYRTLTMTEKYFGGIVPAVDISGAAFDESGERIKGAVKLLHDGLASVMAADNDYNFGAALEKIWELVARANKYVEVTKPWNLEKEKRTEDLKRFIRLMAEVIRAVSREASPFIPGTCAAIDEQAGTDTIRKGKPLFPRIETKK
ncbi:MAG: class I tRNA ligase family protein, partial [Candidatus Omnitrophica bacterium]|nr:class I tRNA ligase family protein [Candidatus Omnitrophota bacterium]